MDTTANTASTARSRTGRFTAALAVTGLATIAATLAAFTGTTIGPPEGGVGVAALAVLSPRAFAAVLAATGVAICAGLVTLRAMAPGSRVRTVLGVGLTTLAVGVLALACDATPLAAAGYAPILLIGGAVSPELRQAAGVVADPPVVAQLLVVTCTVLVIFAVAAELRAVGPMSKPLPRFLTPQAAARWGRVAVIAAIIPPVAYALTRVIWALGWHVGVDLQGSPEGNADLSAGVGLAAGAAVGVVLTSGLVRPWGERFWAWVPRVGGKPIPVALAVVPATVVAALLLPAGVGMSVAVLGGAGVGVNDLGANWAALGTTLMWPVWSLALGAATLAYAARRGALSAP